MYQQGMNHIRGAQDWQIDAYEMRGKHNSMIRHQRTIDEMEHSKTPTWCINASPIWGINISEVKNET
jgi:hypothetical protein